MSIANKPKIIITAIACRPYVEAAVACGYAVVAIDAFADAEVNAIAESCYQLEFSYGQLNMHQLLQVMNSLDLDQFVGFCYGAGFEKEPEMLARMNTLLPVIGNLEQVVSHCKAPDDFFSLCERLQVPYPKVMFSQPCNADGWLRKEIGASGGAHIQLADLQLSHGQKSQEGKVYYQQFQQGQAVSCLFVASNDNNQHRVQVIGFNEQLINPCDDAPFRYGGAVSNVAISDVAKARFEQYIGQLSEAIGLVGLNSCDAICNGDAVYVLEINPRLSATIDLYVNAQLFEKHMAAVKGEVFELEQVCQKSHAQQIIYAEIGVTIKANIIWPSWVYDRPKPGSFLAKGMPVCTVTAEAETADLAKCLVNERAVAISRDFLN